MSRRKSKAVGDVVEVALEFRLGGKPLGPLPLQFELFGERVAIVPALHIAPSAGIAVPEPGSADPVPLLEDLGRQAQFADPVKGVQPGRTGPDDDDVEFHYLS